MPALGGQHRTLTLNGSGSTASGNGNSLTVTVSLNFKAVFAGSKAIYLYGMAADSSNSGWQDRGTWNAPAVGAYLRNEYLLWPRKLKTALPHINTAPAKYGAYCLRVNTSSISLTANGSAAKFISAATP
jgi:hypothetical protein